MWAESNSKPILLTKTPIALSQNKYKRVILKIMLLLTPNPRNSLNLEKSWLADTSYPEEKKTTGIQKEIEGEYRLTLSLSESSESISTYLMASGWPN